MISDIQDVLSLTKRYSENFVLQFGEKRGKKSKIKDLYQYLTTNTPENANSKEIALQLGYSDENEKGFKLLCSRLEDKILSSLILIDYKQNSSKVRKKIFEIIKKYLQGQMLLTNNKRAKAIKLLEKTLKDALNYEQTHIAFFILEKLNSHYSFINRNDAKWQKYNEQKKIILQNLVAEHEAETMYNELSHYALFKSKSDLEHLNAITEGFAKQLEIGQKTINTFRYNLIAYQIRQFHLNHIGEYEQSIELSNEALAFLSQNPFFNRSSNVVFSTPKVDAYLNLGKHTEAITEIENLFEHITPVTFNWFKNQRKLFFVHSLTSNYQEMYRLTSKMTNPKLYKRSTAFEENWKIREAYIHFLARAGKIHLEDEYPLKNFRIGRFLNDVPQFSKDKQGVNTAILIVQILFFIEEGRLDKIQDKLDTLNKYCHRYLRKDETYRFNCFIKMLLRLPEAEYNPIRTQRYVKKYIDKLRSYPREKTIETFSAEIIDFEKLWTIIIEILPVKGYKSRRRIPSTFS